MDHTHITSCVLSLTQAPFCVHPKTGKVCVPLDPEQAHLFDPETVPTVQTLLAQVPQQQLSDPRKVGLFGKLVICLSSGRCN